MAMRPNLLAWLPPGSLARVDLHLSRPVAETPALEATFRAGPERRRDRPRPSAGRRIPVRQRHGRTTWPGRCSHLIAIARLRMDGGARRRLAPAVAGFFRDPLRGQGQARRPRALLSDFPQDGRETPGDARVTTQTSSETRSVSRAFVRRRDSARTASPAGRWRATAARNWRRRRRAPGSTCPCRPAALR